jgi:hypothetical protein
MNMKCAKIVVLAALLLPSLAMAQTNTRATFAVTKDFADGNNVAEVTVSIDCNTGIILDQDKDLGDNDSVVFVVTSFTDGTLNCSITESGGPAGYSATYLRGPVASAQCSWTGITNGTEGTCLITNEPDAVEIEVTKTWNIVGDNNDVNLDYRLRAYCDNIFDEEYSSYERIGTEYGEGPGSEDYSFYVRPGFPSSSCYVSERVYDSAIEVDNGCGNLTVSAGVGDSCEIVNTVFFEGIPTLSQYGMAIMALLMLGVGFVGFRRFV